MMPGWQAAAIGIGLAIFLVVMVIVLVLLSNPPNKWVERLSPDRRSGRDDKKE